MRIRWCTALVIGLLVSPALAGIVVSFAPLTQDVAWAANGQVPVNIVADIPEADAIIGWGLDLGLTGGSPTSVTNVGVAVDAAFTVPYIPDGDGLAGLVPPYPPPGTVWGPNVVLATVTLQMQASPVYGKTYLDASYTPGDYTEGFMTENGFAQVSFVQGWVNVTPEPTSLLLLAALGLLRRR